MNLARHTPAFLRQLLCALAALILSAPLLASTDQPTPPAVAARAWMLYDVTAGQVLGAGNADAKVEPASLTKLMTAYVVFNALKSRTIAMDQLVTPSEKAWRAPGSRMFIDMRRPVTVNDLIHGMIIQSGNDACIALAETIAGSEEAFVAMMNREAKRLGLANTSYRNTTGLTEAGHTTTVRDLVLLSAAMVRDHAEHYAIYAKRDFTYNNIRQENRNRLLWLDPTVDGMKTGHTDAAGYCLVATAKRGPRRLISVVTGTSSDSARTQESQKLLNFGFQAYDAVKLYAAGQSIKSLQVWKGKAEMVNAGFSKDFVIAVPRDRASEISAQVESLQPLSAPIAAGARIGTLKLALAGRPLGEYPLVALEAVPSAGFIGRAWDSLRLMLK